MASLTAFYRAATLPDANTSSASLLKTDAVGRLRISHMRRNALLDPKAPPMEPAQHTRIVRLLEQCSRKARDSVEN